MIHLAIVGSSGNQINDMLKLDERHIKQTINHVLDYIENTLKKETFEIILVSGGSPWIDHVAIQLFLTDKFAGLQLYLPSKFDVKKNHYVNTHEGRKLNELHNIFSKKIDINSLFELTRAILQTKNIEIKRGFLQRNNLIAKNCDHLLVFTFEDKYPTKGDIAHTWKKVLHQYKKHYTLI
uniref:Uncharacterized protein n=1 Tax=viral metagenome TaxID=1070528 RepID=A0A6C0LTY4_9ZZZZ